MDDSSKDKEKYVMISYNWGVQPKMLELKEFLASNGIKIWMDVDNMGNKMPVSMADAVENATLVLVAMTEKYQSSDLCYKEANYAKEKKVPIVPLLLQRGYKPAGWLELLMTGEKYVDLSTDDYKQKFGDVLIEVNHLMNITDASMQNTKPAVAKPTDSLVTLIDKVNIQGGNIDNLIAGNQQVNVNIYSENDNRDPEIRKHAKEFLRRVKVHFSRTISDISNLTSQPTKMILDMEGIKESGSKNVLHGDTNTLFGRDIKPVELDQLHDDYNGKPSRHVMILGDAGAGKSTITKMYSARVAERNIKSLDGIELVHLVNAMFLQSDYPSTAFDLLFTQQMSGDPDTELTPEVAKAGELWINRNADKMLIAIDGLDQLTTNIGGQRHPNINASTPSRCDHILANIMSGKVWRGARIVTSSRWDIYWSLMAAQKPDKVIGLRGLDNDNMKNAIMTQIKDGINSETLLHNLQNNPKLLALCRNPLFLQYTSEIFQNNTNKLPDSISGLMSELFVQFIRSNHSSKPELDGLTKLAFELTLKNRFYSTRQHLKKLKVDPDKLKGFLSSGTSLSRRQEIPIPEDEMFVFTHQTLQDFCSALHMLNLDPTEVRSLAAMNLQEDRMEMMRKLFYGIILDNKNTDRLRRYLEDRSCSVDECRDILFKQLVGLIPGKTITDIRLVHLLSECGNAAIDRTKSHVQNIDIIDVGLLPNDQITLATLIKHLAPLNSVYIHEVIFHKFLDAYLKESPRHTKSYQVQRLALQDEALAKETIDIFLTQLRDAGCKEMGLTSCCLTEEKLHLIAERCKAGKTTLSRLAIYEDEDMPVTAYREISWLLQTTKCKQMLFGHCDLSSNRLYEFGCGCHEIDMTLSEMFILDSSMTADAFKECATTLHITKCKEVTFWDCNLTVQKLSEFGSGCFENSLSLLRLSIVNETMPEDGYSELSRVVNASECSFLQLQNCNLNQNKLISLHESCRENNVTLSKLSILDSSMTADAFKECAATLHITQCKEVTFADCNLTVQKLSEFGSGCLENSLSLSKMSISDSLMTADAFKECATTLHITKCKEVTFGDCNLTVQKLSEFGSGCLENSLSLSKMSIWDSSMTADVFKECATTLHITKCKEVTFGDCNLTVQKLSEFGSGCLENSLSLSQLSIVNESMTEDGYSELSRVVNASECSFLLLQNCDLNQNKLISFHESCRENNVTLSLITIIDNIMTEDGYSVLANVINSSRCSRLRFENCALRRDKLIAFYKSCRENNVKLSEMSVWDSSMTADAFKECATTLHITKCKEVIFGNINLTVQKLSKFGSGCLENSLSLLWLSIVNETMTEDGYSELSRVVNASQCSCLLLQNCDLNQNKLISFHESCRENNITMAKLQLNSIGKVTTEVISALCELMIDVVESLVMLDCEVDDDDCLRLKDTLNLPNTKVKSLRLPNEGFIYKPEVQAPRSKPRRTWRIWRR